MSKFNFYRTAFDSMANRRIDDNGRLIVNKSLITKAEVSPYYGSEIPDYQQLGLEPEKRYNVLRPIEELKKCISDFEMLPLLSKHIMDYADEPQKEDRAGSVGRAEIEGEAVFAPLNIWDKDEVQNVQNETKRELSLGYMCDFVLRKGEYKGTPYELVMENIKPNHLALVESARVKGAKVYNAAGSFKEEDHPRDKDGKFANATGNSKIAIEFKRRLIAKSKRILVDSVRAAIYEHGDKMKIGRTCIDHDRLISRLQDTLTHEEYNEFVKIDPDEFVKALNEETEKIEREEGVEESNIIASKTKDEIEDYIGKPTDDIETLKANGEKYYREHLKTSDEKGNILNPPAKNKKIGDVIFSKAGRKEMLHNTHYERLKTLPFVRDIIEKGEMSDAVEDTKHPFIDNWYYATGTVEIDGEPIIIQVDIAEDENGNRFYISNNITNNKKAETNRSSLGNAASASDNSIDNKSKAVKDKQGRNKQVKVTDEQKGEIKQGGGYSRNAKGDTKMKTKLMLLKAFGVFDEDPEKLRDIEEIANNVKEEKITEDDGNAKLKGILIAKLGEEKAGEILAALNDATEDSHWGHAGRPGEVGGSQPDSAVAGSKGDVPGYRQALQAHRMGLSDAEVNKIKAEAKDEARQEARNEFMAIEKAKDDVALYIGKVSVQDSATAYYKLGCQSLGVNIEGLSDSEIKSAFIGAKSVMDKAKKVETVILDSEEHKSASAEVDGIFDKLPVREY